mgnify:CR=1 FL=1
MAKSPFDNSILWAAPDIHKLILLSILLNDDSIMFTINKFGQNTDIDANETEDIWTPGGTMIYTTAAEQVSLVSTSTSDDVGGYRGHHYEDTRSGWRLCNIRGRCYFRRNYTRSHHCFLP